MSLLLDLLIVAVLVFGLLSGVRRGFVRTVIELIGYALILVLAFTAAGPVSEKVYDKFVRETVEQSVSSAFSETAVESIEPSVDEVYERLPDSIKSLLAHYSVTPESVKSALNDHTGETAETLAGRISDLVAAPFQSLIRLIVIGLLFAVGLVVIRLVAKACNSLVEALPLVGGLNRFLGGTAGLLKGAVISVFVANLLMLLLSLSSDGILGITVADAEKTTLFIRLCVLAGL